MMPLFSKSSLIVLESLSFTDTLYAFDFDGTLAKIVRVPSEAYMGKLTEELLKELSSLVPVAIVSGRSLQDLKKRVHFKPQFLIGNHGLEVQGATNQSLQQSEKDCCVWLNTLKGMNFGSGVEIENKKYTLAIHYRRSRSKKEVKSKIQKAIAELTPKPRIVYGKSVVNLLPLGAPHKGAAILDVIHQSKIKHIFYIGDDDTDEDVFELDYTQGQNLTVRVGQSKVSHAKYYIKHQTEINRVIKTIIGFHRVSDAKNQIQEVRP